MGDGKALTRVEEYFSWSLCMQDLLSSYLNWNCKIELEIVTSVFYKHKSQHLHQVVKHEGIVNRHSLSQLRESYNSFLAAPYVNLPNRFYYSDGTCFNCIKFLDDVTHVKFYCIKAIIVSNII